MTVVVYKIIVIYWRNNTYTHTYTHTYTTDSPFNATLVSVVVVIVLLLCAITIAAVVVLLVWIRYAVGGDQKTVAIILSGNPLSVPCSIDLTNGV